jgi:chromosomal replication initiation ATPase DnaA
MTIIPLGQPLPSSISVSLVPELLSESEIEPEPAPDENMDFASLQQIAEAVADLFKIDAGVIRQKNRNLEIIIPRYFFCKVANYYGFTCTALGEYLGQDHATVLNAIKQMNSMLDKYAKLERAFDKITLSLKDIEVTRIHQHRIPKIPKISKIDNIMQKLNLNE